MTATLDDLTCLLYIPVQWKMMDHEKKISQETGVQLMIDLFGVVEHTTIDERAN